MNNEIAEEYCFRQEVLPLLVFGVLINLAGPFLNNQILGIPLVFMDMSGTAVVALLLGPWWAAAVGLLANAFNGLAFSSYFPFGIVNIMGGLVWGYWFRLSNARAPNTNSKMLWFRYWISNTLQMVLIGALVCGVLSFIIKLILYPQMGLPLHYYKPIYLEMLGRFNQIGIHQFAEPLAVLAIDLYRDLCDKIITVTIAVIIVITVRFAPDLAVNRNATTSWQERLSTDAASILLFVVTQFLYLLIARFTTPEIHLNGALQSVNWLRDNTIITLLYSPIIIAVAAFLFFSFNANSKIGSFIDRHRKQRLCGYLRFVSSHQVLSTIARRPWFAQPITQFVNLTGIVLGIAIWPYRNSTEFATPATTTLYLLGMAFFSVLFFKNKQWITMWIGSITGTINNLHSWMDIRSNTQAINVMQIIGELLQGRLLFSRKSIMQRGKLLYCPCYHPNIPAKDGVAIPHNHNQLLIIFIVEQARTITYQELVTIETITNQLHIKTAIIIANDPIFIDQESKNLALQMKTIELLLLPWQSIERLIAKNARGEPINHEFFAEGVLQMTEKRITNDESSLAWEFGNAPYLALANRALSSLAHIIDKLLANSHVVDFGCGRGRHTLYALLKGHHVIAIDKQSKACEDLAINLNHAGILQEYYEILENDFLDVDQQSICSADLVIITGVLQHCQDAAELTSRLCCIRDAANKPGATIFIEMLFDMKFDGNPPAGRLNISVKSFEESLLELFPTAKWQIERVTGPAHSVLDFSGEGRSFFSKAKIVEQVACEYVITDVGH